MIKFAVKILMFNWMILILLIVWAENGYGQTHDKPNILWIVADDLGPDLGCFGNKLVKTPNVDKLASQGKLYTNFFTVSPVCSVSRSALITGMYPTSIECHQHRTQYKDSLPDHIKPVTEYFKEAGYFVCNKGKTDYNFIHNKEDMYNGTNWSQRNEGQPFFAQVQVTLPHRPFLRDDANPINEADVKLAPYYPNHKIARKDWAMYLETIQIMDKQVGVILDQLEKDGLADNTIVFFFGDQGRPHMREKQFLYDGGLNTPLIIRWPDNIETGSKSDQLISNIDLAPTILKIAGLPLPQYLHGQDFLEDHSRKFIFASRDRMDETVDRIRMVRTKNFKYIRNFYPERPYTQFNAYKKHSYPTLTLMQVLHDKGKLTPQQEKFMASHRPAEELYDLVKDPYELNNLADHKKYLGKKIELKKVLEDWMLEADLGTYPEDKEEIDYAEQLMKRLFKQEMEKKGLNPSLPDEEFLNYWEKYLFQDLNHQ